MPTKPSIENPLLLTTKEAAAHLRISEQELLELISSGQLPVVDIAPPSAKTKRQRVRREDLLAFIASCIVNPARSAAPEQTSALADLSAAEDLARRHTVALNQRNRRSPGSSKKIRVRK